MPIVSSALEFLKLIRDEKVVYVKFEKKDGTIRTMKCTLDFNQIPRDKRPKNVNLIQILTKIQKSKILSVYDLEKEDWRSIPFEKLEFLQTPSNGKLYRLEKLK